MMFQKKKISKRALTSNIIRRSFTYKRLTPKDFPIEAKNIIHNININSGVTKSDSTMVTSDVNNAMISTEKFYVEFLLNTASLVILD